MWKNFYIFALLEYIAMLEKRGGESPSEPYYGVKISVIFDT